MNKHESFETFLMQKHCEENPRLLDDMLPDDFGDWLGRISPEEIIEYAEEWNKLNNT